MPWVDGKLVDEHTYPELPCPSPNYEKDDTGRCMIWCYHNRRAGEINWGSGWEHIDDGTECD